MCMPFSRHKFYGVFLVVMVLTTVSKRGNVVKCLANVDLEFFLSWGAEFGVKLLTSQFTILWLIQSTITFLATGHWQQLNAYHHFHQHDVHPQKRLGQCVGWFVLVALVE
jgi:hypothetical protein